jgi:hypothetical protein
MSTLAVLIQLVQQYMLADVITRGKEQKKRKHQKDNQDGKYKIFSCFIISRERNQSTGEQNYLCVYGRFKKRRDTVTNMYLDIRKYYIDLRGEKNISKK